MVFNFKPFFCKVIFFFGEERARGKLFSSRKSFTPPPSPNHIHSHYLFKTTEFAQEIFSLPFHRFARVLISRDTDYMRNFRSPREQCIKKGHAKCMVYKSRIPSSLNPYNWIRSGGRPHRRAHTNMGSHACARVRGFDAEDRDPPPIINSSFGRFSLFPGRRRSRCGRNARIFPVPRGNHSKLIKW